MDKVIIRSNRSFGVVFFVVFLIISLYPLTYQEELRLWSLYVSLIFLLIGILIPFLLSPLNFLWFKFGLFLGKVVSPIAMGIVYFVVVFPTFLFIKIFKKNYLNLSYDKGKKSYWIKVEKYNSNMRDQF